MKNTLGKLSEAQSSSDRKLSYSVDQINTNLQTRNDQLKTSLDDLSKRLQDQSTEIDSLHKKVEDLSFAVDSLSKKLGMSAGGVGTPNNTVTPDVTPTPAPQPGDVTPPAAGGSPVDQAFASGLTLYQTGRFKEAREAFRQALEQKPEPEVNKAVDIQFYLAEACLADHDTDAAVENYTHVINTMNTHPKAWVSLERLADIMTQKGNSAKALEWYKEIVSLNSKYPDIQRVKDKIAKLESGGGGVTASPTPISPPVVKP